MLDWIVRLIYLIFLVCKTRHKFVYIYNLYIFFSLYILYTSNKKNFLCIRLRDLGRNDPGLTGSSKKLSFVIDNSRGKEKHGSLSAFSILTGFAHPGLKSELARPLSICYMVLESRRLSPQQDPLCRAHSNGQRGPKPRARGGYCTRQRTRMLKARCAFP